MNCKDRDGYKNVKFIMALDDDRAKTDNWEILDTVDVVKSQFTSNNVDYKVYSDWSVGKA
jgi:hypothetical protein